MCNSRGQWSRVGYSLFCAIGVLGLATASATAQGTKADYERANSVGKWTAGKVRNTRLTPAWTPEGKVFWYRSELPGGKQEFVLVDTGKGTREIVTEDQLPKDAKPVTVPKKKFTPSEEADDDELYFIGTQPSRRGGESPDRKSVAFVKDHNVWLRDASTKEEAQLSKDGSASDSYGTVYWAPDSKKFIAIKTKAGGDRKVTLVDSSPRDQLQPKTSTYFYLKPGDAIPLRKPYLFDVEAKKEITVSDELFPNPWDVSYEHWSPDSKRFTFVYNQRGHTVMRVLAIDAETGKVTPIVNEECKTFFDYAHKLYVSYLDDSNEMIWMSERDGWNHLYLVDLATGKAKNITSGKWVVRGADRVDAKKREVWFRAMGIDADQDPYHVHYCRINFDGTGLVRLTEGDGTHSISYSPDRQFIVDTYSRVDLPPVHELRRVSDGSKVLDLEKADATALLKTGWSYPQRFVAKGRDGETDIHGYIVRPSNFDPQKKYPVIESIYAGPHDHHVRKAFSVSAGEQSMSELGFILVKIDGMGTSWRSKAFHDVCWKNLGDSGFPDRVLWIKAAAAKHPEMDFSRGVGIYGGSAGGQSTMRGMTEYPDFYTVGVADCGCHDNRMDKIWWNELWMSWPVGPQYAEQSNVTNAHKLKGKLMLTLGELDRNVDPSSTLQVVNALIRANKDFDFVLFPGGGHGAGGSPYGARRRMDFFVRHLLDVEPRAK